MFASPRPLHFSQASFTWTVKITRRANIFVHVRHRLQPIGQDDVRVHRRDVQVINQRIYLAVRVIAQFLQLLHDAFSNLFVVFDVIFRRSFTFVLQRVPQIVVNGVDEFLVPFRFQLELDRNVRAKHARLQALHVASNVRLAFQRMAVEMLFARTSLLVRAHDVSSIRFNHEQRLAQRPRPFS